MSVGVTCTCGKSYQLKDEMAGRLVQCPECGNQMRAPVALSYQAPPMVPPVIDGDPGFARDRFLLRQKHLSLSEKYFVWDEQGQTIFFVERPAHLLRQVGSLLITALSVIVGIGLAVGLGVAIASLTGIGVLGFFAGLLMAVGAIGGGVVLGILVSAKRHVSFYRDEKRGAKVLEVLQDKKFNFLVATFTVRDGNGKTLALLRKNYLYDFFRKQWECRDPQGQIICMAKEDSIILSLLRRFLGPMLGLLRANFVFTTPDGQQVIGEFNRKFTLLDRYVLDMSADPGRSLDRRLALAIGVMLDTAEKR